MLKEFESKRRNIMTETTANAYVELTFKPLITGEMKLSGIKKLRELDQEVKRVYEQDDNHVRVDDLCRFIRLNSFMEFPAVYIGDMVDDDFISGLKTASDNLNKIEREVKEYEKTPPVKIYI